MICLYDNNLCGVVLPEVATNAKMRPKKNTKTTTTGQWTNKHTPWPSLSVVVRAEVAADGAGEVEKHIPGVARDAAHLQNIGFHQTGRVQLFREAITSD